jgi:hypothetical protein
MSTRGTELHVRREMRYLVAGAEAITDITHSMSGATAEVSRRLNALSSGMDDLMDSVADGKARSQFLMSTLLRTQADVLVTLRAPAGTAAAELQERATSAARRQLWDEAVSDYALSIEKSWDQPGAHLGHGLATLGKASERRRSNTLLLTAADSFEKAYRYARVTEPALAVCGMQYAVVIREEAGQKDQADALLKDGVAKLPSSPELAFSAGLRFRDDGLLARAVLLDPSLAIDPAWQSLPFALSVVFDLQDRQRACITRVAAALTDARSYGPVAEVGDAARVRNCTDGYLALQNLAGVLDAAQPIVAAITDAERGHREAAAEEAAAITTKEQKIRDIRNRRKPWVSAGIGGFLTLCAAINLLRPGGARSDDSLLSLPALYLLGAVLIGTVIPAGILYYRREDTKLLREEISGHATREAEHERADDLLTRRLEVLDDVEQARSDVEELLKRSPEAYPIHSDVTAPVLPAKVPEGLPSS